MAMRTNTLHRHFASTTSSTHILAFNKVLNEISGVFSDETTDAADGGVNDVTMPSAIGDRQYYGSPVKFDFIRYSFFTNPNAGTRTWEYWNGSAWTSLTPTALTGNLNLTGSPETQLKITPPSDWATTTVDGTSNYWVRNTNATTYTTAGVADTILPGNILNLGSMTYDIAETASRTIRAVAVQLHWTYPGDQNLHEHMRVAGTLGAAARTYLLDDDMDLLDGGNVTPGFTYDITFDATSYFNSNFGAGASQTFGLEVSWCYRPSASVSLSTMYITNVSATVTVTYEYDDASLTTATKTVFIPFASHTALLTTTLAEIGTNQVPALDTFCPEASKSYKEICFVMEGATHQSGSSATPATTIGLALDAESEVQMGIVSPSGGGMKHERFHWLRNDMTTNATHALKARTTNATYINMPAFAGYLAVTYTYNASTTTRVLQSLMLPLQPPEGYVVPHNVSADTNGAYVDLWIEEPGTITLAQSAVVNMFTNWNTAGWTLTYYNKVGSQGSFTGYSTNTWPNGYDYFTFYTRFDSGAAAGAGVTLARGKNRLGWLYYVNNASVTTAIDYLSGFNGYFILNYTADKAAAGVGAHNRTVCWPIAGAPLTTPVFHVFSAVAPNLADSNYHVSSCGYRMNVLENNRSGTVNLKTERLSGEGSASRGVWIDLAHRVSNKLQDARCSTNVLYIDATEFFRRGTWDTDAERLVLETSRRYVCTGRVSSTGYGVLPYITMLVTYHSITKTVSGTVTDGSGTPQSGATVTLHRTATGEKIGSATTNGSGVYTITWFDDTEEVFTETRISGALIGRSDNGYAS